MKGITADMGKSKLKIWHKVLLSITGLTLIAILIVAVLTKNEYAAALLWIVAVLLLLTWGNMAIHRKLNRFQPWTKYPLRRFLIQLLISGIYSLACINVCYYFLKTLFLGMPPDLEQIFVLNLYGLLFIIPIISINFAIYFMIRWKKAFLQSEKFREENIRSRFESLKTHIDPHFLFNNLNVLSSLIDKDPADAHHFLNKFADVYRYVLQHRDEELVDLKTEFEFIRSYIFLFQQRLDRQLKITVSDLAPDQNFHLPPLSIQMLVENAIKHNKATAEKPLLIQIYIADGKWLVVRNSYSPKIPFPSDLPKTGLKNISKRMAYFTDEKMQIDEDSFYYTVKLPLLEWDEKESFFPDPLSDPHENRTT